MRYCTKKHRHHGVWDDAVLKHRVLIEARCFPRFNYSCSWPRKIVQSL